MCVAYASASHLLLPFLFNPTAPPAFSTLSLHDALPIYRVRRAAAFGHAGLHDLLVFDPLRGVVRFDRGHVGTRGEVVHQRRDRKSTRLNSSHTVISYAVFCLKKKTK